MGGVLKVLVVLLVVGVAAWFWLARNRIGRTGGSRPASRGRDVAAPQAMVACAHCGLHLPAADAVADGALHYCSPAHRRLGPADR